MHYEGQLFTHTVNLTDAECAVVYQFARDHLVAEGGFSASLRAIIEEWHAYRQILQGLPPEVRALYLPGGLPKFDAIVTDLDITVEQQEKLARAYYGK